MSIPARKSLGQHFLPRPQCEKVTSAADVTDSDRVLEIGSGPGTLTRALATTGAQVLAVELDSRFLPTGEALAAEFPNLTFVAGDFLDFDLNRLENNPWKVVANIPYYITTPILEKLLTAGPQRFSDLYVLMQREVAARIMAEGERESGSLTHFVAWHATARTLLTFRGRVFVPPAQVDSTLVHFHMREKPPYNADPELLFRIIHTAFEHRRKMLRSSLRGLCDESGLQAAGVSPTARPEQLRLEDFAKITACAGRPAPR
ncbi:MAG: 16S rRNA (adenine(1518)-N(6)/adenine(1519)-N(6))-dimethyltransferase RsmA [Candidatus Xenobia bacterium]